MKKVHKKTLSVLCASMFGAVGLLAHTQAHADVHPVIDDSCKPTEHYLHPRDRYYHKGYYKRHGDEIQLTPPEDTGFREAMGGTHPNLSTGIFHAAEGTMFAVELPDGRVKITFDFHHLLPYGVYSLWDVINPNYQTDEFADQPLVDESLGPVPSEPRPGFLGGYPGLDRNWFQANLCGSANFTIETYTYKPHAEFLLDYHSNGFQSGTKGETVFPGVLWGKFPDFSE